MKWKRLAGIVLLLAFYSMAFAGCTNPNSSTQSGSTGAQQPKPPTINGNVTDAQVKVYFATKDALYLVPETHTVVGTESVNRAKEALAFLISGPKTADLTAVIPPGSTVRDLKIRDGIAYADFSDALVKKHIGGSTSERLTVVAIVNTLTEFPDIQKVQILVEGKKVGTLAGHLDISQPLSRSEELNKK